MSLEIRSGGAIAVDTDELRATAASLRQLGGWVDELAQRTSQACAHAAALDVPAAYSVAAQAGQLSRHAGECEGEPGRLAGVLESLAACYDIIELTTERALAHAAGDADTVAQIDAQLARVAHDHPDAAAHAEQTLHAWRTEVPAHMAGQTIAGTWWMPAIGIPLAGAATSLWSMIGATGVGSMRATPGSAAPEPTTTAPTPEPGARTTVLRGHTPPAPVPAAVVRPVAPATATTPVPGLAAAAERVPGKDEARVRIEKYAFSGGGPHFAVYIAGTQALFGGGGDPFDMTSNAQLYTGEASSSLAAVRAALDDAGVGPEDPVHVVGHSQGAMLASALALDDAYTVRTLVTFGSPVEAAVSADVLSVGIRHLDDPVAALAGGGHPHQVGAAGSFIAQRVADPGAGVQDLQLAAHGIEAYAETGAMVDASADPRATGLHDVWRELGSADRVEVTEYAAHRDEQAPAPRGRAVSRFGDER